MTDFQRGNAFLYILVAVVLLGALMFTLSRSAHQENTDGQLDEGKAKIFANEIISYAATTTNAVVQMQQGGATVDQIDFMYPSDTNFNTAPTIYKLFHPDGGGLNYKQLSEGAKGLAGAVTPVPGFYVGRFNNVEWSPTSAQDVILTAFNISQPVCAELNRKVNGSTTIPLIAGVNIRRYLLDDDLYGAGTNTDLTVADCAACEDKNALCVSYDFGGITKYAFYNIIQME